MDTTQREQKAFSWLKQIPGELFNLDEKPLFGVVPEFPWQSLSNSLGQIFELNNFIIQAGQWQWLDRAELFSGLGADLRGIAFNIPPLNGTLWWAMSAQDIISLMKVLLIKKEASYESEDIDNDFIKAFYRFLAVEALHAFDQINTDKQLSVTLGREEGLPSEACLCMDISLNLSPHIFYTRLFLSPEFQKSWRQRHLQTSSELMLSSPMSEKLNVILHLEAGRVHIKPSEWKKISAGDYIILENCSITPDEDGGRVTLVINDIPYFRGRLKDGNLKISEHSLYHEVDTVMDQPNEEEKSGEFEPGEEDFDFSDEISEVPTSSEEEDFEIEGATEPSLPGTENEEKAIEKPQKLPEAHSPTSSLGRPSLNDIPLPIVIEVGRIQMSIKKLLELQPGNMLELDIHPEAGVDLVVHGKRVARGELLRIGETLGVRILEL